MAEDKKNKLEQEITELTSQRDLLKSELEAYKTELTTTTEGKPSIREQLNIGLSKMEDTLRIMSENVDKINSLFKELNIPTEGQSKSKFEEVSESYEKVIQDTSKIEEALKTIENFKLSLFGDEETKLKGLKQRIDSYEEELKEKKKTWEENSETLFKKIEGLLPGATSTGLAKAYQDQRKSYNAPYLLWAGVFVLTMLGMICFAIKNLHEVTTLEDATMRIVSRLPFFIPTFWLAIFASKQQSQSKRLQQEYAYKESLTKSYEADKREIEKLPDSEEKNKLSAKLLDIMIDMARQNPSETLQSKSHDDKPPSVFELFKMNWLKKISGKGGE